MGWRYRKSINLGAGFRVNFSSSGIGYSWGTKHFRVTKTATGKVRTTTSIPGTGLSYVKESKTQNPDKPKTLSDNMESVESNDVETINSDIFCNIINIANKTLKTYCAALIALIVFAVFTPTYYLCAIPLLLSAVLMCYARSKGKVQFEYDTTVTMPYTNLSELIDMISTSSVAWHIKAVGDVREKRKSSGASQAIDRIKCKTSSVPVFPFTTNIGVVTLNANKFKITIFPDKIIVIKNNKVGILAYSDLDVAIETTNFVESQSVPADATVVSQAYQYVNNNGTPDQRYKDNPLRPVCKYTTIEINSKTGFKEVLMLSKATES